MDKERIIVQAERLVKRGRLLEAVDEYKTLLTGEEQDVSVKTIIGDLYIKAKRPEQAVDYFSDIADFYEQKGLYSKSIAIHRRISKLVPGDIPAATKLADLYRERGFLSDAGREYKKLAECLIRAGQKKKAVVYLEKLLQINTDDNDSRMSLIQIHRELGDRTRAVEELNKAAEWDMRGEDFDSAEKCLLQAVEIMDDDLNTLEQLVYLYSRQNQQKRAFAFLQKLLDRNRENKAALYALGSLYFDQKEIDNAERLFLKVAEIQPDDIKTRIKLGKIHLACRRPDEAFKEYEHLIDGLLSKHKISKAIGLLGLILSYDVTHVATLQKLISIYKMQSNISDYLLAARILLSVFTSERKSKECRALLEDMLKTAPDEPDIRLRLKAFREASSHWEEPAVDGGRSAATDVIEKGLAEAAYYVDQGLIRNAERILNRMQGSYPDDSRIRDKMEEVRNITSRIVEKEIEADPVDGTIGSQVSIGETVSPTPSIEIGERERDDTVSSQDIFKGTDLFSDPEHQKRIPAYYDLSWIIEEELQSIRSFSVPKKDKRPSAIEEKDLGDIVREFRKGMESKFGKDDFESRYTLGIAFLEQELYQEAVEEFKVASGNESMRMDCYHLISLCFRKSGDFRNALEWVFRARDLVPSGSAQDWDLKYELADLYEAMGDRENAVKLFSEIQSWNPRYRDVRSKLMALQK